MNVKKYKNRSLLKHINNFDILLQELKNDFLQKWSQNLKPNSNINEFKLISTLGSGSFGKVILATHKSNDEKLAIKILEKKLIIESHQLDHCKQEANTLRCANFQFLINLRYFFIDNVYIYFAMSLQDGGEMFIHLKKLRKFDERHSKFYAAQVILAIEYLHNVGIIYRDLKPENIIFSSDGYIKLADFGFCKKLSNNFRTYTFCGTPEYLAPEIILSKGYGFSVDWWALGILIFEMCAGYSPFRRGHNPMKLYEKITHGKYQCPTHFSRNVKHLLTKLIEVNVTKRFGNLKNAVTDIKSHEWFVNVDWDGVLNKKIKPPYKPKYQPLIGIGKGEFEKKLRRAEENEFSDEFKSFSI